MKLQIDKSGMKRKIFELPEHMAEATRLAEQVDIGAGGEIRNVVIAGMGGSAIAGDILKTVLWHRSSFPVEIVRYYSLPSSVTEDTLVIVISYSGNTEETLSCFSEAKRTGARILCISSGGELRKIATAESLPFIQIPK